VLVIEKNLHFPDRASAARVVLDAGALIATDCPPKINGERASSEAYLGAGPDACG